MVTLKRIVSPDPTAPSGPVSVVCQSATVFSPQTDTVTQSLGPPPNCLESLGGFLRRRGVSREAATICAAHSPSMQAMYHAKWRSFCHWCSRLEKDSLQSSIRTVLNYLQHLRRSNLKHTTILSHISALSLCMNKVDWEPVGRHPLVARWVLCDMAQNLP